MKDPNIDEMAEILRHQTGLARERATERDEAQAEVARLRELLASATAQIHRTQEERDEWMKLREASAVRSDILMLDLMESEGEIKRWKAATQKFVKSTINNPDVLLDDYFDAYNAIEDGDLPALEKSMSIDREEGKAMNKTPKEWAGPYTDTRGPCGLRVYCVSSGAWVLSQNGKEISRHDSRNYAMRKAIKIVREKR